jgi:hypothetical protein
MSRSRLIGIALATLVLLSYAQPALAQKTGQKANPSEVVVMIVFCVIAMKALSYARIP